MILVVDDDLTDLERAQDVLNRNRQVFLASDSKHGFELARKLVFSVALVDLNMRGIEGLDLIRKLHANIPDLPIISICGDVQGVLADSLRAVGVVEFLQKPITPAWKPVVERIRATRGGSA
jgi:CheY-like chemotaxis protein